MLGQGERVPDATVMLEDRKAVKLWELLSAGPVLLVFYLFDWSAT